MPPKGPRATKGTLRTDEVGDDTGYPVHLGSGSLFVLVEEREQQAPRLYLPDGTYRIVGQKTKPPMGFK